MSKSSIYIGLGFIAFGLYELSLGRIEEMVMYCLVGIAFIVTWVSFRESITPKTKKLLTIASWILIGLAGFMFLFLVRTDAQR